MNKAKYLLKPENMNSSIVRGHGKSIFTAWAWPDFPYKAMKTTLPDLVHCIENTGDKCMLKLGSGVGLMAKLKLIPRNAYT